MGLLHASCGRGRFASCLGGELLAWGLATGGLACGLLGTSHVSGLKFSGKLGLIYSTDYLVPLLDWLVLSSNGN